MPAAARPSSCRRQQLLCLCSDTFCSPGLLVSWSACALDGVCDVEDELHVHGGLRDTRAASVDDGDQGAVQLVHVALREEAASAAGLVLHLRARRTNRHTLTSTEHTRYSR